MAERALTIRDMDTATAEPGPTQALADFAATTTYDDLPAQVVADAKLTILDWFGSMLAGALEPPARIAREVVRLLGTGDDATLFPAARSSAAGAALGSAGTQAAGLWEFNADGAMSKHLHPGKAAFNGVLAADLAARGFTAATRILEGERGFFRATSTGYDASRVTVGLGSQWKVSENCYKLHSCCGHTHTAIDTAQDLRSRHGWHGEEAAGQIAAIDIALYGPGYDVVRRLNPRTPYQAKFSVAYCVAAALIEGTVGLEQFDAARFGPDGVVHPSIAALIERTTVHADPALSALYPERWPARLTITLTDGRTIEAGSDYPRGNPENPVPLATLEAKFRDLVAPRYDAALADCVIAAVRDLEHCADIAAMMRAIQSAIPDWARIV